MSQHKEKGAKSNLQVPLTQVLSSLTESPPGDTDTPVRRRFLALDGLRGVAVLLVLLSHGSQHGLVPKTFILNSGWLGVVIFFALSGFLITHLLLEERTRTGQISLANFYMRRSLRIWPLYFAVLGVYAFVFPLLDQGTFNSIYGSEDNSLIVYPFFLQNYLVDNSNQGLGLDILWSLAVEEHFYLFWPLLLVALRGRWLVPVLASIAITAFGLRALTIVGMLPTYQKNVEHMTHTALEGLAVGCIIACLYHLRPEVLKILAGSRWLYLFAWLIVVFLAWVGLKRLPLSPQLPDFEYYRYTLATLAAAIIVVCVVGREESSRPILRSRPLTYIGQVSYGMYVLHPIVLGCVALLAAHLGILHGAGYLMAMVAYLIGVVGVAGLSFKFFETPFLRFKKHFTRV
jgi:peptidoglycan/LPS O-acetylase OafA/YrhL